MPQLRNHPLYVRILSMIAVLPMTALEMRAQLASEVGGQGDRAIRNALYQMHSRGLVFVARWVRGKRGPDQPAWQMGQGPDAPRPPSSTGKELPAFSRRQALMLGTEMLAFVNLVEALRDPHSTRELMEVSGNSRRGTQQTIRRMRDAGIVHIAAWERFRANGCFTPYYQLGRKRDKPRPKPMPLVQVWSRHRERLAVKKSPHIAISTLAAKASVFNLAQAA